MNLIKKVAKVTNDDNILSWESNYYAMVWLARVAIRDKLDI